MVKVAKVTFKSSSVRSRAARRAASPAADIAKSSKPEEYTYSHDESKPDVLAVRQGSGVSKKKKQKPMSRHQRLRREKGVEKAYAVADQLEIKLGKSKDRNKIVKERAADWVDVNAISAGRKRTKDSKTKSAPDSGANAMDGITTMNATDTEQLAPVDIDGATMTTASTRDLDAIT